MTDESINRFVSNLAIQSDKSARTVGYFLRDWEVFSTTVLKTTPSEIIKKLKVGTWNENPKEEQPYEILQNYAVWLKRNRLDSEQNNERTVKLKLHWARSLLERNFVQISATQFKALVKTPKPTEPEKTPIDKKIVSGIILALDDIRLQSFVIFLASMGWRVSESMTMRLGNLENFNMDTLKFTGTPMINSSGKHAKTKVGKRRQLTTECARQVEKLIAYTYREREITRQVDGKWVKRVIKPTPKITDKLFAPYHDNGHETEIVWNYEQTASQFRKVIDRLGVGKEESGKRRKITLHTFRRFVYITCIRALDEQYAKFHTGRKVHEYAGRTPDQIAEDFQSVEPYLTFLDTSAMDARHKALEGELANIKHELNQLAQKVWDKEPEDV